jgi:hypothetical protein
METQDVCLSCGNQLNLGSPADYPGYCHVCAGKIRHLDAAKQAEARSVAGSAGPSFAGESQMTSAQLEAIRLQRKLIDLNANQNLALGVLGGAVAAIIAASVWAIITFLTEFQIGWMAIGVGFLVGVGVRQLGRGVTQIFGIAGAAISVLGCLLGNILSDVAFFAHQENLGYFEVLGRLNPGIAFELLKATFHPMDILFWALAISTGYRYSRIRILIPR